MAVEMHVNSFLLFWSACRARDRAKAAQPQSHELALDAVSAVVLAVVSTEAFINEFGDWLWKIKNDMLDRPFLQQPKLAGVADALRLLEEEQGKLALKYQITGQLLERSFVAGANPLQDFLALIKVRNALVHFKPLDRISTVAGTVTNELPKFVQNLQNRGLAQKLGAGAKTSWFTLLQTPEMAAWACDTALSMIHAVLDMVTEDAVTMAFEIFRHDPFADQRR